MSHIASKTQLILIYAVKMLRIVRMMVFTKLSIHIENI